MDKDIIKNVAYCGLICPLDSCYINCNGCKMGQGCGDKGCFHKKCCLEKSLNGCWECEEFPCPNGYFSDENKSKGQFIACIKYIKENSLEKYVETIMHNGEKGLKYGLGGDYANKSEDVVMNLLKND